MTDQLAPHEAKELFLDHREAEVSPSTLQGYHYRLRFFVNWCQQNNITDTADLQPRHLEQYKRWRKDDGDLKPVTLNSQLSTLRVFLKFCESIGEATEGLHDKLLLPSISQEQAVSDTMLEGARAEAILSRLSKYRYASKEHALFAFLWHTGCRIGAAHAVNVGDFSRADRSVAIRYRPGNETHLKNKKRGERMIALADNVADLLADYIGVNRDYVEDDYGNLPLFTTRNGRMGRPTMRDTIYKLTRPCFLGNDCTEECRQAEAHKNNHASRCTEKASPHDLRRGRITQLLRDDVPKPAVSDRVDSSPETLEKHYSKLSQEEKMEQRRDYFG